MGKFLVESGAIAPNATPQLRRWSIKKIKLGYPQITSDTFKNLVQHYCKVRKRHNEFRC